MPSSGLPIKLRLGKDRLFEAEILSYLLMAFCLWIMRKTRRNAVGNSEMPNGCVTNAPGFRWESQTLLEKILRAAVFWAHSVGELDSLRQGALDADFKKMQAKIVLPNSKREINLFAVGRLSMLTVHCWPMRCLTRWGFTS
jgi:hypothetical protein